MDKCKVVSIINQKGGTGKTTTAVNLSYTLAEKGKKVAVLDFDPQSNLTMCFGVEKPDELKTTIYDLMMCIIDEKELPDKSEYVLSINNIDIIPCSIQLSAVEMSLVNVMSRESILKMLLESIKPDYDYIIVDCMPALGMLTVNALAASDSVVIPALCETFCYAHLYSRMSYFLTTILKKMRITITSDHRALPVHLRHLTKVVPLMFQGYLIP